MTGLESLEKRGLVDDSTSEGARTKYGEVSREFRVCDSSASEDSRNKVEELEKLKKNGLTERC